MASDTPLNAFKPYYYMNWIFKQIFQNDSPMLCINKFELSWVLAFETPGYKSDV